MSYTASAILSYAARNHLYLCTTYLIVSSPKLELIRNVLYRWKLLVPYYSMPLEAACICCAHVLITEPVYFQGYLPI